MRVRELCSAGKRGIPDRAPFAKKRGRRPVWICRGGILNVWPVPAAPLCVASRSGLLASGTLPLCRQAVSEEEGRPRPRAGLLCAAEACVWQAPPPCTRFASPREGLEALKSGSPASSRKNGQEARPHVLAETRAAGGRPLLFPSVPDGPPVQMASPLPAESGAPAEIRENGAASGSRFRNLGP